MLQRTQTRAELYRSVPIAPMADFLAYYEEGTLSKRTVEAMLANALVGKQFDPYGTAHRAGSLIESALIGTGQAQITWGTVTYERESPQYAIVRYKNQFLCSVSICKKKGRYHSSYFSGGYYDWSVAKATVCWAHDTFDLATELKALEGQRAEQEAERQSREELLAEQMADILEQFKEMSDYQIHELLAKLAKKYWVEKAFTQRANWIAKRE